MPGRLRGRCPTALTIGPDGALYEDAPGGASIERIDTVNNTTTLLATIPVPPTGSYTVVKALAGDSTSLYAVAASQCTDNTGVACSGLFKINPTSGVVITVSAITTSYRTLRPTAPILSAGTSLYTGVSSQPVTGDGVGGLALWAKLASLETLIGEAGDRLPAIVDRLRRFASRKPGSPLGHFLLALAGESKEQRLREAIAADGAFWPAHFELGRLLRESGKRDEAAREFEATLRHHASHEGAHFALASLYAEAGERGKAKFHREAHHTLRAQAAEAERQRSAAAPRIQVTVR